MKKLLDGWDPFDGGIGFDEDKGFEPQDHFTEVDGR